MRFVDVAVASSVIGGIYSHYLEPMASDRRKDDVAYAMTPFKQLMWPIGVWPLQVYNVYSLMRWLFATCCVILLVILLSIELHTGCTDAQQKIESLMVICCGILATLKNIWFRIYASNLTDNYSSAVRDYLTTENVEHRTIMRRYAFIGKIICYSIIFVCYLGSSVYAMIAILGSQSSQINGSAVLQYTLPSRCALEYFSVPKSMHKNMCLVELICLLIVCTCNCGNDSMFLHITLHICGQVEILNGKLVNFDSKSPQVHDRFAALIQRHDYLIRMTRKLAETINFILLTQLFLSSILLCITGFECILALKVNDFTLMIKSSMVFSILLAQISVYSFVGDYLIFQMEEVGLSIYRCAWYDLPENMTRNLNFVIMQSQSPVKLQAGSFVVLNLSCYMSILKTSISYLSVLRVMVEN